MPHFDTRRKSPKGYTLILEKKAKKLPFDTKLKNSKGYILIIKKIQTGG